MSFTIPCGQELEPFDLSSPQEVKRGFDALLTQGGVLFGNIPESLHDDGQIDSKVWAHNMANVFMPELVKVLPEPLVSPPHVEARRQTHHARMHLTEHNDPTYRDPYFWGETTDGATAEFRFSSPLIRGEQKHYWFNAAPGTLWLFAGPKLLEGERVFHAVGAPQMPDGTPGNRKVTIGSLVSKRASSK